MGSVQERAIMTTEASNRNIEEALRTIQSHFAVAMGEAAAVEAACSSLQQELDRCPDPILIVRTHQQLLPLISERRGPVANILFHFLEAEAGRRNDSLDILTGLLQTRDDTLRLHTVHIIADLTAQRKIAPSLGLVSALASAVEQDKSPLQENRALVLIGEILRRMPPEELPGIGERTGGDPIETLFLAGSPLHVRCLAARVLDAIEPKMSAERLARAVGAAAGEFLAPFTERTRATHLDIVEFAPDPGAPLPALPSLIEARTMLGQELLAGVIAELGWAQISLGVKVIPVAARSFAGSYPFLLRPSEAAMVEKLMPSRKLWNRFLIIAHGGKPEDKSKTSAVDTIQRFRRYNVVHAEALNDFLEVAPLTPVRVRRLLHRVDHIVEDFIALFGSATDEAARLPGIYQKMRASIEAGIAGLKDDSLLPPDVTQFVEMFEDPHTVEEVRTLHGLKRYLHQRGLLYAFRLFRAGGATNRTVALMVAAPGEPLQTNRSISYLDFEPDTGGGNMARPPFAVQIAAEAFARHMLYGRKSFPTLQILNYGNEIQVYIGFRNHPAFVRMDFSPPLRGGMIDLEYFAVSQYEMDRHPDLSLQAIQRLFQKTEYHVRKDGFRLHARYDRERAFDFGDINEKAKTLFAMSPYLMDVDWAIASLDYPEPVRRVIADAWSEFFLAWGVLPGEEVLTSDKRKILKDRIQTANGVQEIPWEGTGEYRDLFSGKPPLDLLELFRTVLAARGLDRVIRWYPADNRQPTQLSLERYILQPLREAIARGEAIESSEGLHAASPDTFVQDHEADRFCRILAEGGEPLRKAARMASLAAAVDRHLQFQTTGSIQGYAVQRAPLYLRGQRIGLAVLRNRDGQAVLALPAIEGVLYRVRKDGGSLEDRGEHDEAGLIRHLRRDNYLSTGFQLHGKVDEDAVNGLPGEFLVPNPRSAPPPLEGEKIIHGAAVSPGRASGLARFANRTLTPADYEDAIFIAPFIQPEDAPYIERSAGVVSTSGGILSDAGLVPLSLQRPAVIMSSRWSRDEAGLPVLQYNLPVYQEESAEVCGYRVVRRTRYSESEETLREGDLIVVNAEDATVMVLGHDPDTIGFHKELSRLHQAVDQGRPPGSMQQLEDLLLRTISATLARHAVEEILLLAEPLPTAELSARERLLRTLLANPRSGAMAREIAYRSVTKLARRHDLLCRDLLEALPGIRNVFEPLFLRLQILQWRRLLQQAAELLRDCGLPEPAIEQPDIDGPIRRRLSEQLAKMERRITTEPGWAQEHMKHEIALIQQVLGKGAQQAPSEQPAPGYLSKQNILTAEDGGIELRRLIGRKAAHIAEVSRVLGAERVPRWFAISNHCFQTVLQMPAAREASPDRTVGQAIDHILSKSDLQPSRKSAEIRNLWESIALPKMIEDEILDAYHSLFEASEGQSPVVMRSSTYREDREQSPFPRQFGTFLFVQGDQAVLQHVKLAWAGLWNDRALQMRAMLGDSSNCGGGIIIQKAVRSRVSGIVFTVNPVSGKLQEMSINVGLGLGQGIVSGAVDVDHIQVIKTRDMESPLQCHYHVGDKREQIVFDQETGWGTRKAECVYHQRFRPALEYAELCDVVQLASTLELAFREPLDIEFAIQDRSLFILQVRPIAVFHSRLHDTLLHFPLA